MLIVAMFTYFFSRELAACPKRIYNNYFSGLFHDLPEVLTRDIISPIKRSVAGLEQVIKEYEDRQINEKILPLLPPSWHTELLYLLDSEFLNKIMLDGSITRVSYAEICKRYNADEYLPVDGELIKGCDQLAAYTEAVLSIEHGIKTKQLVNGKDLIYEQYSKKFLGQLDFGKVFRDFA